MTGRSAPQDQRTGYRRGTAARKSRPLGGPGDTDPREAALFAWYSAVRPELEIMPPGDLIASWWHWLGLVAFPVGDDSATPDVAARPGEFVRDSMGDWFVRPPIAQPEPELHGVVVLTLDGGGLVVVTADAATHDREEALRTMPTGDDASLAGIRGFMTEQMPSGRRDGSSPRTRVKWRKSHDNVAIARALVALGLTRLGSGHRPAIRTWLRWELGLGGEFGDREALEALEAGWKPLWRPYEDSVAVTNRRVWKELGANLYPKNTPGSEQPAGHERGQSEPQQKL